MKAYSSEVERTAHNGLVVGSNPTKPNLNITFKLSYFNETKIKKSIPPPFVGVK